MIASSLVFASSQAPIALATGPHKSVSTGLYFANSLDIKVPSLRTITGDNSSFLSFNAMSTAFKNLSISGTNLAFKRALTPLFIKSKSSNSSCPQTTGIFKTFSTRLLVSLSKIAPVCLEKISATAIASLSVHSSFN